MLHRPLICCVLVSALALAACSKNESAKPYAVEEVSLAQVSADLAGKHTTSVAVTKAYIDRIKAYNGVLELLRMGQAMVDHYCQCFQQVPRRIVLDNLKAAVIRAYTQDDDRPCGNPTASAPSIMGSSSTPACRAAPNPSTTTRNIHGDN